MLYQTAICCVLSVSFLASAYAAEPAATKPAAGDPDSAPELTKSVPKDFVERKTKEEGVTLRSPREWREEALDGDTKLNLIADDQGRGVNLVVVPATKTLTLQRMLTQFPEDLSKQVPGFKLLKADFVKLSGTPAARLVYDAHLPSGDTMRVCQIIVLKNEKQYIMTYAALEKSYEGLLATAEQVAASIKVP